LKNKQNGVSDKDKTIDNVQKRDICASGETEENLHGK
jgi:hypothetical protein